MSKGRDKQSQTKSEKSESYQEKQLSASYSVGQDPTSIAPVNESAPRVTYGQLEQVGPYKIVREIGEGGMGCVYEAEQAQPVKRKVAIKVIRAGRNSRNVIARFEAERQALALMDHPTIARIIDAGETVHGQPYFAMELVDGVPLTQYCDEKLLTIDERLELFVQICDGIQHAHQKGIIHRDLKPGNILVAEYDGKPVPKIIDFGLAKALETTQQLTDKTVHTEFGQVLGTLKYMSPEQAGLDALDIDTRSDIYSLGVILYELLTGSTPMDSSSIHQKAMLSVLEMVRAQDAPRPSLKLTNDRQRLIKITSRRKIDSKKLSPILAGELDWIVMKSLEKDRNQRYSTASTFADDVRRYLNDEPVDARPYSDAAYKIKKFVRKNRGLVASLSTIAALLLIATIGTTYGLIKATRSAEKERIARNEAEQLRKIADQKSKEAELRSIEAVRQTKRADAERDVALQVTKFLQESFLKKTSAWERANASQVGSASLNAGNTTIKELLDVAAEKFSPDKIDHVFPNQPRVQTEILSTIAKAYETVEEQAKALLFAEAAAEVVAESFGPNSTEYVVANINHFFTCLSASERFAAMTPLKLAINSCITAVDAVDTGVKNGLPDHKIEPLRKNAGRLIDACIQKSLERLDPTKHALPVVSARKAPDAIPQDVFEALNKFQELNKKLTALEGDESDRARFLGMGMAFVDYAIGATLGNTGSMKESAERFADVILSSHGWPSEFELSKSTLELSLAYMYENLGLKPNLSLQLFEKTYLKINSELDETHPATVIFGIAYADALYARKKYNESFEIFSRLAPYYFLQLGAPIELYTRIVNTAIESNRQVEAQRVFDRYLELVSVAYGDQHENTHRARYFHALYPARFGNLKESISRFKSFENDLRTKLGPGHHTTLKYVVEFAELSHYSGGYRQSIEKLKSYRDHFDQLGAKDVVAIKADLVLSRSYQLSGRFEESVAVYKKSIQSLSAKYGNQADSANRERVMLIETYLQSGQNEPAIEIAQQLIQNGQRTWLKAADPRLTEYQVLLARGYYHSGQFERAAKMQTELLGAVRRKIRQSKQSVDIQLAKLVFELSKTRRALKETEAAEKLAAEALSITSEKMSNSIFEISAMTHLAGCKLDQESEEKISEAKVHLGSAIDKILLLPDKTNPIELEIAKKKLKEEIERLDGFDVSVGMLDRLKMSE